MIGHSLVITRCSPWLRLPRGLSKTATTLQIPKAFHRTTLPQCTGHNLLKKNCALSYAPTICLDVMSKKTKMVMIVHGFPNNISALRFEWAWQNPTKTTRLQHLSLKRVPRKETEFRFQLRVVSEMLRTGPWCRLPLTIRWLEKDFYEEFPPEKEPPSHMKICHGPVKSKNLKKLKTSHASHTECLICSGYITSPDTKLCCLNPKCDLICHITCLAQLFLEPTEFVPIQGQCPFCGTTLKWGDLIRKMRGCGQGDELSQGDECSNDDDEVLSQDRAFVDNNSIWLQDCDEL